MLKAYPSLKDSFGSKGNMVEAGNLIILQYERQEKARFQFDNDSLTQG